ncbi:magnesium and cobalt transporter [Malonomonas rubra DSM 5091]|uniref:Magnesium and cobalt transporter n=1 Tax=Malonomonas rubra DSM 5091 TaxID=1122189 RepID=A0A1M6DZ01_MALRU|nr:hemolysin family protein [Malonomonas rubra]SHI78375.1 magnesium and cobalt transporter [Malonomonas rubra DSM 5091]
MESDNSQEHLGWSSKLKRLFRGRPEASSEEELQNLIDASEQRGIIDEDEGDMLQSILELDETIVREVMVPRTDMVCVDADEPFHKVLDAVLKSGHSRIPIYKENNDNIIGLVYAKDLLRYWGQPIDEINLEEVLRQPFLVPESKLVSDLLQEFRKTQVHIAIVIDEYGGTSGLVTIEDLIEEIVGDIQDEYDLEDEWLIEEEGGTVLVDGRLNIEEFEEHFEIEVEREKFDTVGGYLVEHLGRVPAVGEHLVIDSLEFQVEAGDQRAIRQIRVLPLDKEEVDEL